MSKENNPVKNPAAAILLKTLTPTVRKFAESGKLDGFFQHIKSEAAKNISLSDDETVEIIISTESDYREHVSLVIFNSAGMCIKKVIETIPLSDMILKLLSNI